MRALICSTRMPEFDRECGSKRVFDLLQALREAGWSITYVAQQAAVRDRHAALLRRAGIPAYVGLDTLSEEFLRQSRFDLAVLAFWHIAEECLPPIRRFSPHTRVIVDSIDLHFLRHARGAFHKTRGGATRALPARAGDDFVRELNTYAAADAVLAVSEKETELIADIVADAGAAHYVPLCEEVPRSSLPFAERTGMLFMGNFWHKPNADAAEYLVTDILPHVDRRLLAQHPAWIVGNASDNFTAPAASAANVRVVGWVPSLLPYVSRVRLTTVPLRYGAGIKGKLVQSLMAGTPVVSTSLGAEGLPLEHGRNVLIADDARAFADAIESLLTDESLWNRLTDDGRQTLSEVHGREAVAERFLRVVDAVLGRLPKPALFVEEERDPYDVVRERTKTAIAQVVPEGAAVAIVSRGDAELLALPSHRAEHFPRLDDGRYAGAHPASGPAALRELERVRNAGVAFLALPNTAFWWLDHYKELAHHLDTRCEQVWDDESCRNLRLTASAADVTIRRVRIADRHEEKARKAPDASPRQPGDIVRPQLAAGLTMPRHMDPRPRVLVLGIYMVGKPNHADDAAAVLAAATACDVDQRWVALGGDPPAALAAVTVRTIHERLPKFTILNDLIGAADLHAYDYVVVMDDDVSVPYGFLDALIGVQRDLGFALAQPARTSDSYYDHPIVEQQRGVLARETTFVEIGPVFSVHRSVYDDMFPFDLTSAMGWGYENIWAYRLRARGARMGIIDAVPVAHSLRKSVVNYEWNVADAERTAILAKHPHLSQDDCFRVLEVIEFDEVEYV